MLSSLDYLGAALKVVQVARDVPLGTYDATVPTAPADPDLLDGLAERWGIQNSVNRLLTVLAS